MKKTKIISILAVLTLCVGIAWASGGYKVINFSTVSNPTSLVQLLNAIYTEVTALRTLTTELRTDHGTTLAVDGDMKTLVNNLRTWCLAHPVQNPTFVIDTNFDVKNSVAFDFVLDGVLYSEAANQSFNTGTAATFPKGKWGIALLSIDAAGTETVTWATNTANAGYNSEALAIAALPATPASNCPLGYITVQAHADNSFTAGSDALQGGSGGNVSADTNYYNMADAKGTITAAVATSPPSAITAPAATQQVQKGK